VANPPLLLSSSPPPLLLLQAHFPALSTSTRRLDRLNWMGFPVLVSGTSTTTGKFFPWAITLTTNENLNV